MPYEVTSFDLPESSEFITIPVGKLGIVALPGTEELAAKIDHYITKWREENATLKSSMLNIEGYSRESYLIPSSYPRFGSGEGKGVINHTVRGYDLFILCDVFNYGVTYDMYGKTIPMSPDEHYANLKRAISAIGGKAHRITVIMPMLYEGRQHKRASRESLDCAMALQELVGMGVDSILTFDAHDPRVQNAITLNGFENISPIYQMIKALIRISPDIKFDPENIMIISPDEGGMGRAIHYATVLGVELGMFYKRRDYSRIVDGRNPILAHEFLGTNVEGKNVIVVDDMISSGESMLEVAAKLKDLGANRIYVCTCFGLFCNGLEIFDEAYKNGVINHILTTNLVYRTPELLTKPWYTEVEMAKYIALLIDTINHDMSISSLLNPSEKIQAILDKHKETLSKSTGAQMALDI
ncbi:MAG: ribose-phosphate pyrophosphokinase [Ruminococcaceae bacterium]|nr:ribose-phosphate pyrophosphokinase [Oscillospiraceae bacterium]